MSVCSADYEILFNTDIKNSFTIFKIEMQNSKTIFMSQM